MSLHVHDRLSAYMDGELPRADRADVEVHLRECPDCARHLEELAALDEQARVLPVEAPEGYFESFPGRVRGRLEAQAGAAPTHWRPPVWTWAAAAVLLLAVLTPLTYRSALLPSSAPRSEDEVERRAAPQKQQPGPTIAHATPAPKREYGEADADTKDKLRALGYTGQDAERPARGAGRQAAPAKPQAGAGSRVAPAPAAAPPAPPPATSAAPPTSHAPGYAAAPPPLAEDKARAPRENAPAEDYELKKAQTAEETVEKQAETATTTGARGTLNGEIASGRKDERARNEPGLGDLAAGRRAGAFSRRFETLAALPAPRNAEEAHARWDAWRAVARANPKAREADEARVRALEAGAVAYRLSRDPNDLAALREEAAAYLRRADATQGERVRALLADLSPSP